jgi:hypothetical protein
LGKKKGLLSREWRLALEDGQLWDPTLNVISTRGMKIGALTSCRETQSCGGEHNPGHSENREKRLGVRAGPCENSYSPQSILARISQHCPPLVLDRR